MPEINLPTATKQDAIQSSVGTNSDTTSATGSVHAKLKDVKSAITLQVGSTNASASKTGSTNAKLNYTNDKLDEIASNFPLEISGGTDFQNRTYDFTGFSVNPTHGSNTVIDIQGKGILHTIHNQATTVDGTAFFQIDDGAIHSISIVKGNSALFLVKFDRKLKITTSSSSVFRVIYSLD